MKRLAGTRVRYSPTPVSVKGISTAKAVADNRYGELGTGKTGASLYPYSFTPVAVKGL
jgi:hypothetical protein